MNQAALTTAYVLGHARRSDILSIPFALREAKIHTLSDQNPALLSVLGRPT